MAEHDSKPEVSISKGLRRLKVGYVGIRHEDRRTGMTTYYSRCPGLHLKGCWLEEAGFKTDTPVNVRVLPDCIVITTQNTRELYGCAEGLSVAYVNRQKMKQWLEGFPGVLNDTGDLPVYKRGDGRCM